MAVRTRSQAGSGRESSQRSESLLSGKGTVLTTEDKSNHPQKSGWLEVAKMGAKELSNKQKAINFVRRMEMELAGKGNELPIEGLEKGEEVVSEEAEVIEDQVDNWGRRKRDGASTVLWRKKYKSSDRLRKSNQGGRVKKGKSCKLLSEEVVKETPVFLESREGDCDMPIFTLTKDTARDNEEDFFEKELVLEEGRSNIIGGKTKLSGQKPVGKGTIEGDEVLSLRGKRTKLPKDRGPSVMEEKLKGESSIRKTEEDIQTKEKWLDSFSEEVLEELRELGCGFKVDKSVVQKRIVDNEKRKGLKKHVVCIEAEDEICES